MMLKRITCSGDYGDLVMQGTGEPNLDGVEINAPGETVLIKRFQPSHVRYPLIVKRVGKLLIQDYIPHTFWGDTWQFRCGHIYIDRQAPKNIIQRFKYEELHQDIIGQAFAVLDDGHTLDPEGVIEHIHIQELDVCSSLPQVNGLMFSEKNRYRNIHIGQRRLHVGINAPYWLSTNHLEDSAIGGRDNLIYDPTGLGRTPGIRILDVKGGGHSSTNNAFWDLTDLNNNKNE